MPQKFQLPCGDVIDHFEPIQEKLVDTRTGAVTLTFKKNEKGESLKRHVKGSARFINGSVAVCEKHSESFTFIPGHWTRNTPVKPPPSELVVE